MEADNQNFCTRCGHLLSDSARFCPECGARVPGRNPEQVEEEKTKTKSVKRSGEKESKSDKKRKV